MSVAPRPDSAIRTIRFCAGPLWLILPLLACIAVIPAAAWYWLSGYTAVVAWFRKLNPCFYRAATWQADFFTPQVYHQGLAYGAAAAAAALLLALLIVREFRRKRRLELRIEWTAGDTRAVCCISVIQAIGWLWGLSHAVPAYDEVFSAMNCAGVHSFQCAAHYMLPNNHILFNLLNGALSLHGSDPVFNGRLLAGLSGFALAPLLYRWLRSQTGHVAPAAVITIVMLLQFPVWGFAFQARGYSLYLLCAWIAFISLQYYGRTRNDAALAVHIAATVGGFWTMPSFVYWETALCLYAMAITLRSGADRKLPAAFAVAALLSFLVYCPVLCFSGLHSLIANDYVSGEPGTLRDYLPKLANFAGRSIQYAASVSFESRNYTLLLLLALPLGLSYVLRRSRAFSTIAFCWVAWACLVILVALMQRAPFERNLIAHVSLALAAVLLAAHRLLARMLLKSRRLKAASGIVCAALLAGHFARYDAQNLNRKLYFYPADERYAHLSAAAGRFPRDAVVSLSDEAFFWRHLLQQRGIQAKPCGIDGATHYIYSRSVERMPQAIANRVRMVDSADEYAVLQISATGK